MFSDFEADAFFSTNGKWQVIKCFWICFLSLSDATEVESSKISQSLRAASQKEVFAFLLLPSFIGLKPNRDIQVVFEYAF